MAHIFISYSKQDIDFARHLKQLLEARGFTTWLDETRLEPSTRWWTEIEDNIEQCSAFVVVMSPHARESDWVEREILYAERLRRPIFPVLLAGESWPRLANLQYADMRAGQQDELPAMFVRALTATVQPVQHTPPPRFTPADQPRPAASPAQPIPAWLLVALITLLLVGGIAGLAGVLGNDFQSLLDSILPGNSSDDRLIAIDAPPSGAEIPLGQPFEVIVTVGWFEGEAMLELHIDGEPVHGRPIDGNVGHAGFELDIPEPGEFEIRAVATRGDETLGDDAIIVFVYEPEMPEE